MTEYFNALGLYSLHKLKLHVIHTEIKNLWTGSVIIATNKDLKDFCFWLYSI